jgi:dipeptidyl aminopeptidase/acylaminoacyl peptidase/nicotinamidase-related amidase
MKKALLVIDVQNEYFDGKLPVTYPEGSLENILKVMDAATAGNIPVVVVQHTAPQPDSRTFRRGSHEWELHPEVARRPRDFWLEKTLPGSFTGTPLEAWVKDNEVDSLVISGYMTQMCCDTTARQALHMGLNVEFLSDATGTLALDNSAGRVSAEELHRAILVTQQMRFSQVLSTDDWIEKNTNNSSEDGMTTETTVKPGIQPEDLTRFKLLGDVQLSPDGGRVYYDVFYVNREKNIYQGEIWQTDLASGKSSVLTAGTRRDSNPRLSPDGKKLAFLSDRGEGNKKQVFVLGVTGPGEARQLTEMQGGVSGLAWSGDSRYLAVLAETPDDAAKSATWPRPETTEARQTREARELEEKRVGGNPVYFNRVKHRADGRRGLVPGDSHTQIWLVDTADSFATPRQLTAGPFNVATPAFSPDGAKLAFSSTRDQKLADFSSASDLWLIDPFQANAEPRKLTGSKGPANHPAFSPDGTKLAFLGHQNPKDGSFQELNRLWVLDLAETGATGEARCLTLNFEKPTAQFLNTDLRASADNAPVWSADGQEVFFAATSDASARLFRVPADGSAEPKSLAGDKAHLYHFSFAGKENLVAYAKTTPVIAGDVFVQSLDKSEDSAHRVTNLNEWLTEVHLGEPELIVARSQDDRVDVEGWLIKPPGFDPSKKYPLVLEVHGGPHTAYGYSFYHEFQALAGQGQIVLYTNPRGSVGYSKYFQSAIHNDWGNHDYNDIMAVVDKVIAQGYVDETRLGVTGGSYGGYMTNWIISHTDRFKAALTQRCVSNMVTMYTLSDISFGFVESEFEGDIWTNPLIWERSPMAHANKVKTPLLMLHNEADFRCPIEQAEEFYFALKRNGVDVELVRTPNEDHNLSRNGSPDHRIGRLHRIQQWFLKRL